MNIAIQSASNVELAYQRIEPYLHKTPILQSETLNEMLGAKIYFKVDSLQKTGAFKVRGVLNHLLEFKEREGRFPPKIAAYSTGNHGIGLGFAGKKLGLHVRIYLPKNTSAIKQQAAKYYGAEVVYTETRAEAEERAFADIKNGFYYMHPSDSDSTIAGAGTMCYEALQQLGFSPDAIFASCGGGGLISGSYLAKELLSPASKMIGCEPLQANDAFLSLQQGFIFRFQDSPSTVADGLRTLGISPRTFAHLQKLDEFYPVDEYSIYYWTAWLIHLLKVACEPSCALNMAGVTRWLADQKSGSSKNLLVLISGGNIDPVLYRELWKEDYLLSEPIIGRVDAV